MESDGVLPTLFGEGEFDGKVTQTSDESGLLLDFFVIENPKKSLLLNTTIIIMKPWQPDHLPFADLDDAEFSADDESDKEEARRNLNKRYCRHFRQKKKAKVQLLESQVSELTEEVNKLRELAAVATSPDDGLRDSWERFNQKTAVCLSNPECTDLEVDAMIDELEANVGVHGKTRMSKLANTLRDTIDIMLPTQVKLSMWISGSEPAEDQSLFPKWEDFLENSSLTPEQITAFEEYKQNFEQEKTGLKTSFEQFKNTIEEVLGHGRVMHSLIQEVRKIGTPKQVAATIMRQIKLYYSLPADRVLNYGNNSADFLSFA